MTYYVFPGSSVFTENKAANRQETTEPCTNKVSTQRICQIHFLLLFKHECFFARCSRSFPPSKVVQEVQHPGHSSIGETCPKQQSHLVCQCSCGGGSTYPTLHLSVGRTTFPQLSTCMHDKQGSFSSIALQAVDTQSLFGLGSKEARCLLKYRRGTWEGEWNAELVVLSQKS